MKKKKKKKRKRKKWSGKGRKFCFVECCLTFDAVLFPKSQQYSDVCFVNFEQSQTHQLDIQRLFNDKCLFKVSNKGKTTSSDVALQSLLLIAAKIYLFKATVETLEKGVRYVQSQQ